MMVPPPKCFVLLSARGGRRQHAWSVVNVMVKRISGVEILTEEHRDVLVMWLIVNPQMKGMKGNKTGPLRSFSGSEAV